MRSATQTEALALGRYKLGRRIGSGSSGSVFQAQDTATERVVVVKVFDASENSFSVWAAEMKLVMHFHHPHIVPCLDMGRDDESGQWMLVFPYCEGGSLRRTLVSGKRLSSPQICSLLIGLSSALDYSHKQGVIHRDIKPENIVCANEVDTMKWLLTDFGAGRYVSRGGVARSIAGSIDYMAPEILSHGASTLSDQFSLGLVGLELRLQRLPSVEERKQVIEQLQDGDHLSQVIAQMIAPEPSQRFADMSAIMTQLGQIAQGMRPDTPLVVLLCRYLQTHQRLSTEEVDRLLLQWNRTGSLSQFLLERGFLSKPQARTLDAINKGYLQISIATALELPLSFGHSS